MSSTILVPLDGSTLADAAVPHAVELARRSGSTLRIVRVHAPMAPASFGEAPVIVPPAELENEIIETKRAWLEARGKEIRKSSGVTTFTEFRIGLHGEQIVAAAAECEAQVIVCTTHGAGGWAPQWFGSVADYVIRHTLRPVLAMTAKAAEVTTAPSSIMVLLDGSERSATVLPDVVTFARMFGARVELFRVVAPPWAGDSEFMTTREIDRFDIDRLADDAKRRLDATAAELRAMGLAVRATVAAHVSPTRRILEEIEAVHPDMVALATHGRGIARLFVGSVTDKVLRASARPVLCVRPQRAAAKEAVHHLDAALAAARPGVLA